MAMESTLTQSRELVYLVFPKFSGGKPSVDFDPNNQGHYEDISDAKGRGYWSRLSGDTFRGAFARARTPGRLDASYIPSRVSGGDLSLDRPLDDEIDHSSLWNALMDCYRHDLPFMVYRESMASSGTTALTHIYKGCYMVDHSFGDYDMSDEGGVVMEMLRIRVSDVVHRTNDKDSSSQTASPTA